MTQEIEERHNQAMDLAEQADRARRERRTEAAQRLLHDAFLLEKQVALDCQAIADAPIETVAILLQSAAALAQEAGYYREAERLIARALWSDLPAGLAEELRQMWQELHPRLRDLQVA